MCTHSDKFYYSKQAVFVFFCLFFFFFFFFYYFVLFVDVVGTFLDLVLDGLYFNCFVPVWRIGICNNPHSLIRDPNVYMKNSCILGAH